ncbi:CD209 antigen-like protein C [Astyanax mexicanus]|uniref:CD209 antigen-like protein C n=1 Tax=Astyanax mexicanus TaxID=7994 RepID=UPI0020CAED35|nr:CD209 antigen-like protein C [Astyanax mexicanus]
MFFIGTLAGCEAASEGRQVRSGNAAAVGLGLLCFILLAVIVGLSIKHNAEIQQIQNSYTNITLERDQLQTSYTNITLERDQLQTSYTNITLERDQLQTSYDNLTLERDGLQSRLANIDIFCPPGWKKFMSSCYYISINMQTWDQSRMDCRGKGADLVIINSEEEQTFVSGLARNFWIGLTDQYHQGQWKWVDGSSLTSQ